MFANLQLKKIILSLGLLSAVFIAPANAQSSSSPLMYIERAHDIYLNIPDGEQDAPLEKLLDEAESYRNLNPDSPEIWIACAFARALYAGDRTNLAAQLSLFRTARDEFETAIELDRTALKGYATAFLGRLHTLLPGWPLSYGSNRKANKLLLEALTIDANAMANNAYYGEFLLSKGQYLEAKQYLQLAATLPPPSPETPNWHASLLKSIEESLKEIEDKI